MKCIISGNYELSRMAQKAHRKYAQKPERSWRKNGRIFEENGREMSQFNRIGMNFGKSLPKLESRVLAENIINLYKDAIYQIKILEIALKDAEDTNQILSGEIERLNLEIDPNKNAENVEIFRLKQIIKALTKIKQ